MLSRDDLGRAVSGNVCVRTGAAALAACLCLTATGCVTSQISKQATPLANATAPVVDQTALAYRNAEAAYELSQDYAATTQFDAAEPVYNPRTIHVLLTEDQIQARVKVLAAFQLYVKSVIAISAGTDSPALDDASKSLGGDIAGLGNTLEPSIDSILKITPETESTTQTIVSTTAGTTTTSSTTSSSTPVPLVSSGVQNGISTALDALGQFLVYRTIQKDLPGKIETMDPAVEQLCKTLANDVTILQGEEHRDYDRVINQQTLFLRENKDKMDPGVRQQAIMLLPALARRQHATDESLNTLQANLLKLYLTHHALAAAAQGNNPESLKDKLGDLQAAGASLGKFYSSLQ